MSQKFDLIIRNGMVYDGSGSEGRAADVAIKDGKIAALGTIEGRAREEIDASGLMVTPGFVDIHTHYDGQVMWEDFTQPSAGHGVTTAVMGNCGVGFAPCRPEDRERLVDLMEGVEDIPGVVMTEGLSWDWETFGEYLDAVGKRHRDIDVAAQLPHSCLRVYVMGQRASDREQATPDDLRKMRTIVADAMRAGAIGFGTSRSIMHTDKHGTPIPSKNVVEPELLAIAEGIKDAGHGVIEVLFDMSNLDHDLPMLCNVSRRTGVPVSFSLFQQDRYPGAWKRSLEMLDAANAEGLPIRAQVIGRPTGLLIGLSLSENPFSFHPSYRKIARLPLEERVAEMRKPEVRAQILSEQPGKATYESLKFLQNFATIFRLQDPINYEPDLSQSIGAQAAAMDRDPYDVAYDALLEDDGRRVFLIALANFEGGTLDGVRKLLVNDHTVLGLGDGGAHYGRICDASYPTFMLTYWTRDRTSGDRLPLPVVVKMLTKDPATAVGLSDRGEIAIGKKADLNIIDYDQLKLSVPRPKFDLPTGARRVVQDARGYVATIVSGVVTYRNGAATGELPGRLVRGLAAA